MLCGNLYDFEFYMHGVNNDFTVMSYKVLILANLLHKAENLSVHTYVYLSVHQVDTSAVSAWIDIRLALKEALISWEDKLSF